MKKFSSLLLSLSICVTCGLMSNVAVAKKLTDDDLRARAMDQGRTLQSRIRALKKLYAYMLVDGEIPSRTTCVWDVLGKQGPIYTSTVDQQLRLKHYGITMEVEAYTDEQDVVDKLISGDCDTSIMSGAQASQFNDFTGSIESLGGVPSRRHMKYLLQVLASTHAHKKMMQGNYQIVGVIPIGFNLQFEHSFFWQRCISNGLKPIDVLGRPFLDLRTVAVIMNRGEFKGSGLDNITNKPHGGGNIPQLYREKKYAEIESYVKREAEEFSNFCSGLYSKLPQLLGMFKQ